MPQHCTIVPPLRSPRLTRCLAKLSRVVRPLRLFAPLPPGTGTFAYAAPELLLNEPCDSSADLYSFGVLLWEIVTRRNPARGRLLPPQVPDECPAEIVDLIQVWQLLRSKARNLFCSAASRAVDEGCARRPDLLHLGLLFLFIWALGVLLHELVGMNWWGVQCCTCYAAKHLCHWHPCTLSFLLSATV